MRVTDALPAPPTLAAAMRKEVNQMQLAGHGIRVVIATLFALTALASIAPVHGGATQHAKAAYLCPPMC
jgi:hypothetical protein